MEAQKEANHNINNFINSSINDLKNLTNALRSLNKHSADVNNSIINKLLLSTDSDSLQITKDILGHLLHIVDLKGINVYILSILTKVISFIKIIEQQQLKSQKKMFDEKVYSQEMSNILYHIIDIIFLFKSKHSKDNDMNLRIIQTTFSLIDAQMLQYVNYHLLTRIYAICFECGTTSPIIMNISLSALFALTEIIFSGNKLEDSTTILAQFLEYLLCNKKFSWIKNQDIKGLIWDLVIVCVRNFPTCDLEYLMTDKNIVNLLNDMYKMAVKKIFLQDSKLPKPQLKKSKSDYDKSTNSKKDNHSDFIRYYKTFVFFSIHLSIRADFYNIEVVPYKENIQLFKVVYQLQRDSKLYLLLEGISLLIIEGSHLLVEDQRPVLLLDVFSRVIEELCLSNIELEITSEARDLFLQKMCGDLSRIVDSDYVKLIRNTIIKLRKKLEGKIDKKVRTGELLSERTQISQKSELDLSESNTGSSFRRRWQKLMSNVIRIIRYLTSLNMKDLLNEQTVRKLIIQLQYWYLICPSVRTRNLILQELLTTSTTIDSKLQAIKVSQCVQIGSNIIYGYYQYLDSLGLTIILKMMARVKISWEDGKGFEELDEVCTMSEKLYIEQNLVSSEKSFSKTIQAFVQCVNSLITDTEQPSKQDKNKLLGKNPLDKMIKMIEYAFNKLEINLEGNFQYIQNQWNFLTGFWISLCCNRNQDIKQKTMNHIHSVIMLMLKKTEIQQQLILSTYLELAKVQSAETSKLILVHLKQILPALNSQEAIVEIFRITRVMLEIKGCYELHNEVYELEEMTIKEVLFKVKSTDSLIFIIDSLNTLEQDKNEQYKTVNLLWAVSDHLKQLAQNHELKDAQKVWRKLFGKIYWLSLHSIHGQTKQSCIHTFTQVLAESTSVLGMETCSVIIKDIFLEMFYILMSLNSKSPQVTGVPQAEMAKVGIKNLIKLIKKCITDEIALTSLILNDILLNFNNNFQSIKDTNLDYLYEICTLLQFYKGVIKDQTNSIEIDRAKIVELINLIEKSHEKFEKGTVMWRKKYEPAFLDLKRYYVE